MKKKPVRAPAMNPHELLAAQVRAEVLTSPCVNSWKNEETRAMERRVRELEQELERFRKHTAESLGNINDKLREQKRFLLTPSQRRSSMR